MAREEPASCIFCQIASKSTSTTILHSDEKVIAFQDISPSAVRHYLVIPFEHIPSVKDLQRRTEDYSLVSHMLEVGQMLLHRDAPQIKQYRIGERFLKIGTWITSGGCSSRPNKTLYFLDRFGFHQPPLNSVNHLHLHCMALPYTPRWKCVKYLSLGSLGFIEAEKLLEKLKPAPAVISKV
ncbi:Histidine triad nucleotide-binding protein 3 [Morella rubra]|uniref:Histidine triad nucleotide-binding protein 3 n=1 Tax=Morella rubra TaxID=262757 RepID=A0A6A1VYQ8_9ROSI|nr:Histidine triad nucleotide-binding protein 3 [Morella rubra]